MVTHVASINRNTYIEFATRQRATSQFIKALKVSNSSFFPAVHEDVTSLNINPISTEMSLLFNGDINKTTPYAHYYFNFSKVGVTRVFSWGNIVPDVGGKEFLENNLGSLNLALNKLNNIKEEPEEGLSEDGEILLENVNDNNKDKFIEEAELMKDMFETILSLNKQSEDIQSNQLRYLTG